MFNYLELAESLQRAREAIAAHRPPDACQHVIGKNGVCTVCGYTLGGSALRYQQEHARLSCILADREKELAALREAHETLRRQARIAMDALTTLTNERDPECPMCGGPATADGSKHRPECIVSRIRIAIEA